jgi:NAD(P)-dependent dehydrogenase (short-subunit alcohol dehydrogenase family)
MHEMFDVNLFGTAACTEAFLPLLESSPSGCPRIVFMSSQLASLGTKAGGTHPSSTRNFPAYRCSKAAVNMLMLHYASVYGKRGWKINACDPGLTKTSLGGDVMSAIMASGAPGSVEDAAKEACRLATLGADGVNGTYSSKETVLPW